MQEIILAKCGELVLKGLNRSHFESTLLKNLKDTLSAAGAFGVRLAQSTVYIEPKDETADIDAAYERAKKVFGFATISRAAVCEKNMEDICRTAKEYLAAELASVASFKVEAKRADKSFPLKSPALCAELGGEILEAFPNLHVDVHNPDVEVMVEIRDFGAYIHAAQESAAGGMPYGTGGKAILMLSGGIDSPVSGYMLAKRGVKMIPLHFYSPPYTGPRALQKVVDLAEKMRVFCPHMNLRVVHFTEIQTQIMNTCKEELFTVIMRRFMMRVAYAVARQMGAEALVTGESLGQVASQTMSALAVTDATVPMITLRPLIGMDKEEIIRISRKIDTFEISIQPYEDCCTVFTPKHPKTRPTLAEIEAEEQKLDIDTMVQAAVEHIEIIKISDGDGVL